MWPFREQLSDPVVVSPLVLEGCGFDPCLGHANHYDNGFLPGECSGHDGLKCGEQFFEDVTVAEEIYKAMSLTAAGEV